MLPLQWNTTYGHSYQPRYWWRIEPDVLIAGPQPLSTLAARSIAKHREADLLLSQTYPRSERKYTHWNVNEHVLGNIPRGKQACGVMSLDGIPTPVVSTYRVILPA